MSGRERMSKACRSREASAEMWEGARSEQERGQERKKRHEDEKEISGRPLPFPRLHQAPFRARVTSSKPSA